MAGRREEATLVSESQGRATCEMGLEFAGKEEGKIVQREGMVCVQARSGSFRQSEVVQHDWTAEHVCDCVCTL